MHKDKMGAIKASLDKFDKEMSHKPTLGAKPRNVVIDKSRFGAPTVTHDGVSVVPEV